MSQNIVVGAKKQVKIVISKYNHPWNSFIIVLFIKSVAK